VTDLPQLGRVLVAVGLMLLLAGAALMLGPRVPWLGRLPGDILIDRPGFRFYFPLATCLLLSLLLTGVLWLLRR
jgi:Protein of unknown function (DUF2905)